MCVCKCISSVSIYMQWKFYENRKCIIRSIKTKTTLFIEDRNIYIENPTSKKFNIWNVWFFAQFYKCIKYLILLSYAIFNIIVLYIHWYYKIKLLIKEVSTIIKISIIEKRNSIPKLFFCIWNILHTEIINQSNYETYYREKIQIIIKSKYLN